MIFRHKWLWRTLIVICFAGICAFTVLVLYLNQQVLAHFGELRWQIPTRVYARPLVLRPQLAMDAHTLLVELNGAGYHPDQQGMQPGSYFQQQQHFTIASRGFLDVDGPVQPQRVVVDLANNHIVSLQSAGTLRPLESARLDPARIATLYGQKHEDRRLVQLNEVPDLLVTGLQAVEDKNFKTHHGVDLVGIGRAIWVFIRSRGHVIQGASTLTQQLARSGLLGIGKEQTLVRKFKEILYALLIELHYDKRTILETYLNQVYLGQRGTQEIHGIASAANFWFGRDLNALNDAQIALLIGLVKGPSYYDPRHNPQRALERRNFVLQRLHDTGLIDDQRFAADRKQPLQITPESDLVSLNRFSSYVDLVRMQLKDDYPDNTLRGAGMTILTGMSYSAQSYAEDAVRTSIAEIVKKSKRLAQDDLESGAVVTDSHTGDVLAVVGGRQPDREGFNRALDIQRPVGSLLKPFVYLLALATPNQWSLASWIDDSPISVPIGRGQLWTPVNADRKSHGTVRLIDALAYSYNQATVRLGMQVTPERLAALLHVLAGVDADPNPSLLLGATGQSPYAIAQLYQFIASGGQVEPLHAVRGVLDPHGNLLKRYDKHPAPAQPGDQIAANLISIALQRVVTEGTASKLIANGLSALTPAGKTGTTNDGRDSWFVGYTGDRLAVVWMGDDHNRQTNLYGATGAMRVWADLFTHLPSAQLVVNQKGITWQWVTDTGFNTTTPQCPHAQPYPFVVGFIPDFIACDTSNTTAQASPSDVQDATPAPKKKWSWRRFFGLEPKPVDKQTTPPPAAPSQQQQK